MTIMALGERVIKQKVLLSMCTSLAAVIDQRLFSSLVHYVVPKVTAFSFLPKPFFLKDANSVLVAYPNYAYNIRGRNAHETR